MAIIPSPSYLFYGLRDEGLAIENMSFETPQARQPRIMMLLVMAVIRLKLRGPARGDQGVGTPG